MEYLIRNSLKRNPEKFTFAFAGRTVGKVQEQRDREFAGMEGEDTPCLYANYDDPISVIDMCKSCKVVVNVAGPYMLAQGEVLIDACIYTGCHYADVSGEIPWTDRSLKLEEHAKKSTACIIPSAAVAGGYPDVLTYLCAKKLKHNTGTPLRRAVAYSRGGGASAGSSGGTLATRAAMSNAGDDVRKLMANSFALGGFVPDFDRNGFKEVVIKQGTGLVEAKLRKEDQDAVLSKISQCPYTGVWRAPHIYAYFDTRMVRRSNMLFANLMGDPYGTKFNFQEFIMLPVEAQAYLTQMKEAAKTPQQAAPKAMPSMAGEKEMLEQQGKYFKQGEGPPLEELSDAWIGVCAWGMGEDDTSTRNAIVGGDGYYETARCAVEMAMCLVFDWDELPIHGGHMTATVTGQHWYARRLVQSGLKFKYDDWFHEAELGGPPAPDHDEKFVFP